MSKHSKFTKDKDWLYDNYVNKGLTREQLAEQANVSVATIKEYIRKWDVKKPKLTILKEDLIQYINEGLTVPQVAEKYKCEECTIFRYYKKFNLQNVNKVVYDQYDDTNDADYIRLYNEGKSTLDIAKIFNTSATTIRQHLVHNGVELRTATERMWNYHKKEIPKDFDDYQKLYNLYIENGISKTELMRRYNCSKRVIDRVLCTHKIIKESNNSHMTKLGRKLRLYFNKLTPIVLKRDNNTCQLCGSHDNLQVHHIVPFKTLFHNFLEKHNPLTVRDNFDELFELSKLDEDFNNIDNLITYCKNCHMYKVHNFGNDEC